MTESLRALVTGATGQIGSAVVKRLWRMGYAVDCVARTLLHLNALKDTYTERVAVYQLDCSDEMDVSDYFEGFEMAGLRLDVIVHCAAVVGKAPLEEYVGWEEEVAQNLFAPMYICREALPLMNKNSSIILLSSINSFRHYPFRTAYSASKAGVNGFVRALALEVGRGITVNSVSPGNLTRGMKNSPVNPAFLEEVRVRTPNRRLCTGEDVADVVEGLIRMRHVTGQVITVDGGYTISGYPLPLNEA